MKLVFVTNVWNHYQAPLGLAFAERYGADNFRMVLCQSLDTERSRLGWQEPLDRHDWVVGPPKSPDELLAYAQMVDAADVAIMGASPGWMQRRRARTGKLTFIASERFWKTPLSLRRRIHPRHLCGSWLLRRTANRPQVHFLAIGQFAAGDVRETGAFGERLWNWGYFNEVPREPPPVRPDRPLLVLWAGRMLSWKKVDTIIRAAARLSDEPRFGRVDLVGAGPELASLERLAADLRDEKVMFHPPRTPEAVCQMMREADVYILASDRNEGWGVAAGEAMAEGCVLVANRDAGASQVLVRDGETGFLFDDGNEEQLTAILRRLCRERPLVNAIGARAWEYLRRNWSPRVAAERFYSLADHLQHGATQDQRLDGPCRLCLPE